MNRSSILAHRGLFSGNSDKNSLTALLKALQFGFGIETDLRDLNGKVVISHDPPTAELAPVDFKFFLEKIYSLGFNVRIALNIKSDGLSGLVESLIKLSNVDIEQFFVFDMSVPDSMSYIDSGITLYSRVSEYEQEPAFMDKIGGVWVDNFTGVFPQIHRARFLMDSGFSVAMVSPELHRRDHNPLWAEIYDNELHLDPLFCLCTDFPVEAANLFCKT